MWSSIKAIHHPETLAEAWSLSCEEGAAFFSGGTYLIAEHDPKISTLVNLKKVVSDAVNIRGDVVAIGAGVTLQKIIECDWLEPLKPLAEAAKASCPSKNIRNQRTLGGEIANFRLDSELVLLLHALNPQLFITQDTVSTEGILEWTGDGIIRAMVVDLKQLKKMAFLRFAPIPSAVPFLCVAGAKFDRSCRIVVGGNVNSLSVLEFDDASFDSEQQALVYEHSEDALRADHFGGVQYKRELLKVALKRLGETLCQ